MSSNELQHFEDKNGEISSLLHKKSFCLITGASRGIGKEIALRLAEKLAANSNFLLLSRNEHDLSTTANEIREKCPSTSVNVFPCDLEKFSKNENILNFENALTSSVAQNAPFDVAFIIHNAGTVGDLSRPVSEVEDAAAIRNYMETNLISCILLNNIFSRIFADKEKRTKQRVVINISSLLAVQSLPGFGLYAIGKAARDAFMRSLAAEDAHLRVLNYAPGPIKTYMTDHIAKSMWSDESRQWFQGESRFKLYGTLVSGCWTFIGFEFGNINTQASLSEAQKAGTLLTTTQTVMKLLKLLDENKFENGGHIDYFDIA